MITIIVLSAILLFLTGVLFVPIRIVVNTAKKQYYLSLPGYLRADLLFGKNEPFRIKLRIFFISFLVDPNKRKSIKKDEFKNEKKSSVVKKPLSLFIAMLKSISIKYCYANIDTGDFPLNAQLIPLVQQIQKQNLQLAINFNNENSLNLMLQTRGIKLITVLLKHKLLLK